MITIQEEIELDTCRHELRRFRSHLYLLQPTRVTPANFACTLRSGLAIDDPNPVSHRVVYRPPVLAVNSAVLNRKGSLHFVRQLRCALFFLGIRDIEDEHDR